MLSVPPLIFALAGGDRLRHRPVRAPAQVDDVRDAVIDLLQRGADRPAPSTRSSSRRSTTCCRAAGSTSSRSASCWRCGRARGRCNVFVDTITIMHGLGGHRGIVKTRALSFVLYVLAMVTGVVVDPADAGRPEAGRGLAARPARLPAALLLAGRRGDLHLLPGHALPRVGAGPDQLDASTCRARRSRWSCWIVGSLPAALVPHRHRRPTRARSTARWPRRSPYCSGSTSSPSRC